MAADLKQRNFLKLLDFTPEEIRYLLDLAKQLKADKYAGNEQARLYDGSMMEWARRDDLPMEQEIKLCDSC